MSNTTRTKHNTLQPRTRSTYDNRVHGKREASAPPDDRTLNPAMSASLVRPTFDKNVLVVRPLHQPSYEAPGEMLEYGRIGAEEGAHSEWLVRVAAAKYIGLKGCNPVTFLLYPPGSPQEVKNNNPYRVFYRACKNAHDSGTFGGNMGWDATWNKFMPGAGGKGEGNPISPPKALWFMQAGILASVDFKGGKKSPIVYVGPNRPYPLGLADGDELQVVQLSARCGEAIIKLFDRKRAEYQGDVSQDPALPYLYGDPLGYYNPETDDIQGGWFFWIYHPSHVSVEGITSFSGTIGDTQAYECALTETFSAAGMTFTPDLPREATHQLFQKAQFWWDDPQSGAKGLLRFAPVEQQALWIVQAFRNVPRLVQYAFADHSEWLGADARAVLSQRVSVAMPDADPDDPEAPSGALAGYPAPAQARVDPTHAAAFGTNNTTFGAADEVAAGSAPAQGQAVPRHRPRPGTTVVTATATVTGPAAPVAQAQATTQVPRPRTRPPAPQAEPVPQAEFLDEAEFNPGGEEGDVDEFEVPPPPQPAAPGSVANTVPAPGAARRAARTAAAQTEPPPPPTLPDRLTPEEADMLTAEQAAGVGVPAPENPRLAAMRAAQEQALQRSAARPAATPSAAPPPPPAPTAPPPPPGQPVQRGMARRRPA